MNKKAQSDCLVQLLRVLMKGHLHVRLNARGAVVTATNGLAIVAAVMVVALAVLVIL